MGKLKIKGTHGFEELRYKGRKLVGGENKGFIDIFLEKSALQKLKNGKSVTIEFPSITIRLNLGKLQSKKLLNLKVSKPKQIKEK